MQATIPRLDEEKDTLLSIPGNVPMLYELPKGCIFSPRCAHATERCRNERPALVENSGHLVRCFCMRTIKNRLRVKAREERRHE
ncbi:MAG: oligopeptide/dipeptide ABC transporter ATP-binding protein [Clostridium sp.]